MAPIFCVCLVLRRTLNTMYLDRTQQTIAWFYFQRYTANFQVLHERDKSKYSHQDTGEIILKCILKLSPAYIVCFVTLKDENKSATRLSYANNANHTKR